MSACGIFWDHENIHLPSWPELASACIRLLRQKALSYGHLTQMRAYMYTALENHKTGHHARSLLQTSGFSVVDTPHNGSKETADFMMMTDLCAFAIDNKAPATIVCVTGDKDFCYSLSTLLSRQYTVILVTTRNAASSLRACATEVISWETDIRGAAQLSLAKAILPAAMPVASGSSIRVSSSSKKRLPIEGERALTIKQKRSQKVQKVTAPKRPLDVEEVDADDDDDDDAIIVEEVQQKAPVASSSSMNAVQKRVKRDLPLIPGGTIAGVVSK